MGVIKTLLTEHACASQPILEAPGGTLTLTHHQWLSWTHCPPLL